MEKKENLPGLASSSAGSGLGYGDTTATLEPFVWNPSLYRNELESKISSLAISDYIKEVKKEFWNYSISISEDRLWLLSCGEIWNDGYAGGDSRGLCVATEGKQYKYYKNIGASYDGSNEVLLPGTTSRWWLRSGARGRTWSAGGATISVEDRKCSFSSQNNPGYLIPGFSI